MALAVEGMSNLHTHVLLIEDSPGNADLVRGATKEEAEKRVEQWPLVAKYAAKFYQSIPRTRQWPHVRWGRNDLAISKSAGPSCHSAHSSPQCCDESIFSEVLK
jgi:hypothetical protein